MIAKLTLTIDGKVVEDAKIYAKRRNRSVSKLVEEYLRTISSSETSFSGTHAKADITDRITGMFKEEYKGQEYSAILEEALLEKNL